MVKLNLISSGLLKASDPPLTFRQSLKYSLQNLTIAFKVKASLGGVIFVNVEKRGQGVSGVNCIV